MTRSKLRRAIREKISTRLSEFRETELRQLVVSITDTLIDWQTEDGCVEDSDSCFDDVRSVLAESNIEPEKVGDEILKAEKATSQN